MKITIDQLGRIVIPKEVRDRFHLVAGTSLELHVESNGFELRPVNQEPALRRKHGVLVHHGPDVVNLDMADFVNRDRTNRNADLTPEKSNR